MCQVRAYRYACGHMNTTHISPCRVTYCDPEGVAPLCRGSPSLVVKHDGQCRECQYKEFCEQWEARIEEAQRRQQSAQAMLQTWQQNSFADTQDDWGSWSEDLNDGINGSSDISHGLDAEQVEKENEHMHDEVQKLQEQYEQEIYQRWRGMVEIPWDPISDNPITRRRMSKRPGRRCSENSPLRRSLSPDEIDDVDTSDAFSEPFSDDDASKYSSASEISSPDESAKGSPVETNFAWDDMLSPQDEASFADYLSDALSEVNCQS